MSYDLESLAYCRGDYRKLGDCNINIMTHALQYGTMVFGGLRGYYNEDKNNIYIFRLKDHIRRLYQSAKIMQMQPPLSEEKCFEVITELARRNNYRTNVYFRPFFYKSALQLSPRLHDVEDDFAVYSIPLDDYLDTESALSVAVSSWRRIDENIIPTRAKVAGGYANSALAKSEVIQNGFDEAIFLDMRGMVSEGSAENLFMVRDGVLITPPLSAAVLEGITRRSIIQLARDEGITVQERDIARSELYISDELFLTGTGAQVAYIGEIDRRQVGNGQIGPVSLKLKELFFETVRGNVEKYNDWLTPIY